MACALYLADPSLQGADAFRALRDDAIDDFIRCGFHEEAALTRAVSGALRWMATWEEPWETLSELQELRWRFPQARPATMWPAFENVRGQCAFGCGDMATARAAFDAMEANPNLHPVARSLVAFARSLAALVGSGCDPAALPGVEQSIRRVGLVAPRYGPMFGKVAAGVLADFDRPAPARPLTHSEVPDLGPIDRLEGRLVLARLDVLEGRPPAAGELWEIVRGLESLGHVRKAGCLALRLAGDLRLRGDAALAAEMRAWSADRLPERLDRWTLWELLWSRRAEGRASWCRPPAPG